MHFPRWFIYSFFFWNSHFSFFVSSFVFFVLVFFFSSFLCSVSHFRLNYRRPDNWKSEGSVTIFNRARIDNEIRARIACQLQLKLHDDSFASFFFIIIYFLPPLLLLLPLLLLIISVPVCIHSLSNYRSLRALNWPVRGIGSNRVGHLTGSIRRLFAMNRFFLFVKVIEFIGQQLIKRAIESLNK